MDAQLSRIVQKVHALHQITDQARDEHHVQLDVRILKDVLEGSFGAEVRQEHDHVGLDVGPDEAVDVGMPDFAHEFHFFHDVPWDVFLLLEVKLFDPD